ncbi:hypothetical protein [Paenibacillus spongiae]|uniref:Lipoprotein n=1 Tax=Paenibacillus spongiae TaxID=2909671 RepID=A0ABY5SBX0_9BACL|nr:hypothetical protein [Paenibacillus spongiae]UVI31427.1 hypothetical protein L1F29_06285 [Paenibacillus spongiae]
MNPKHKRYSSNIVGILIVFVAALALSGCGSKGTWAVNAAPGVPVEVYSNGNGGNLALNGLESEEPVVSPDSLEPTSAEPSNPPLTNIHPVTDERIRTDKNVVEAKHTPPAPSAIKKPVDKKPAEWNGKGLYIGQIDTHSVEITMNEGPTVFQISQYISSQLEKIPDRSNGTPVVFKYTEKEIILSGEKYIERWLTSIEPSEG